MQFNGQVLPSRRQFDDITVYAFTRGAREEDAGLLEVDIGLVPQQKKGAKSTMRVGLDLCRGKC